MAGAWYKRFTNPEEVGRNDFVKLSEKDISRCTSMIQTNRKNTVLLLLFVLVLISFGAITAMIYKNFSKGKGTKLFLLKLPNK